MSNNENTASNSNTSNIRNMNTNTNPVEPNENKVDDAYIETPFDIIESYFKGHHLERLVRHQLESYNNFVGYQLVKTIEMFNPVYIVSEQDYDPATKKYALEVFITFSNFRIYRPQIHENNGAIKLMFPQEARLRNFTYASGMTIDINIKYVVRTGKELENMQTYYKKLSDIHIGKLPIMLKSNICVLNQYKHFENTQTGECKFDAGGYFIINGSEKTVLGQERAAENRVYCFNVSKNNTKYTWLAEVKSVPDFKCISPKQINMMIVSKNNGFGNPICVQIPRVKHPIPLFIVFRALDVISDKDICATILLNIGDSKNKEMLEALQASIIDSNKYVTNEECIKYITSHVMFTPINMDKESGAKKKLEFALDVLSNDLFPHCQTKTQKIYFLGYMTYRLLLASFEIVKPDDRDSYVNKRVDLTGALLNNLFRNYFNKLVKDMEKQVIREINNGSWKSKDDYENIINLTNIYKIIKSNTIENGIKRALSTGDFSIKQSNSNKVGVAQVLNRLTYVSSLSHARRISTPTDKSGKLIPPRKLHNTSWGFLCPAETPEGQSVGVVKNLSYMTHITIHSNPMALYEYIVPEIISIDNHSSPCEFFDKTKVFINGTWVGVTNTPQELYTMIKDKKYKGIINIYTSVVFDYKMNEIRVCNDGGRLMRPLLRVKNNNILITSDVIQKIKSKELSWDHLFNNSKTEETILEYIDPEEQSWSMIATKPKEICVVSNKIYKYTHCEIHPSTIFGVLASCIPFPEHNQSPRNTYQCAQGKQAMGVYVTNYENRMDKTAYVLNYPTRPLVDTRIMNMIQLNKIPSGTNVIVAIMTHTGYNQEDSLLINKGSIERGLALVTVYHTEKDEDKQKINGDEEIRCKPDPTKTKGMKFGNYSKVNSRGIIPENTLVENRDIIISKIVPIKENKNDPTKVIKYEDQSKIYKTTEETYIDKNYIDRNGEGYNFAKVRTRIVRKPVIGDKFSSRHGQKGTVGNIIPECDMPFTSNGVKPDIIINPHAIPSRMTIGQLKETLLGKVLIELGLFGDGTSFGQFEVKDICDELLRVGYEAHGNELLYNGLTGEQHECSVFMGPVFYQRLKHMVNDKSHSRSIGPMVNLTRQPAEGRSRDGGLRFGEMERDCGEYHSPILLDCGLSVEIGTMENGNYGVLGFDDKCNQLVYSRQTGFLYKGQRECLDVTFQDGRKVKFTSNHKFLTSNNEWVEISNFKLNETKIKTGLTYPLIKVKEEIELFKSWTLRAGTILLKVDNVDSYFKALSFARIIGYLCADGGIYYHMKDKRYNGAINLGHMIDVDHLVDDLNLFSIITQEKFTRNNFYSVRLPTYLVHDIMKLKGITIGSKVKQPSKLPEFILDPNCPLPIVREFLGGLFGGDGHTCVLGMHRGKRDILTSISYSKSQKTEYLDSLTNMMNDIKILLSRFDIHKVTIQKFKETTYSKNKNDKTFQLTLHLDIDELIPFHDKIGFRYCCHKTQRLEAGVSYKRLKNEVVRQHNWIVAKVDELTNFSEIKKENPTKIVATKKAIEQAVEELKKIEPLVHEYAIPSCHDITDHLVKGTKFSKFSSKSFPTAEEYLIEIGALEWFLDDNVNAKKGDTKFDDEEIDEFLDLDVDIQKQEDAVEQQLPVQPQDDSQYGVDRQCSGIPTMNLKVIDIRPAGVHDVYDIEVENTHSFVANGLVAHNCMISHGASRFTRERMYDVSDKYSVHVCKKCGLIASYNDKIHIHHCKTCDNRSDFAYVEIPYACKLLFQELNTMNVAPRFLLT
jgi:DNA-directed RNA polymerase II subunit RPB2